MFAAQTVGIHGGIGGRTVDSKAITSAISAESAAVGKPGGKLVLVNKPKANIYKFFTVPAAQNGGIEVEKYTTKFGVTYEKHIEVTGVITWWRLLSPTT
jgi:hypothetical protein